MKVQQAPLYSVSYRRNGQTFQSEKELFANWTPDTLDKTLYKKDQIVSVDYTKLRNHTVGEALKESFSDVAPCAAVVVPLMGALGVFLGVGAEMAGLSSGAAMVGGLTGAGLGVGLLTLGGILEYRGMRSDAGQTTSEFSGYAYRERADETEVKLVRGDSLDFYARDGRILACAGATESGYYQTRSLGQI